MKIRGLDGHHGGYIHDHGNVFSPKGEITLDEARDELRHSPYVDEELIRWNSDYLFMNKGWYILDADHGEVRVIYLADGGYYIYTAWVEDVLEILNTWRQVPLNNIEELKVR